MSKYMTNTARPVRRMAGVIALAAVAGWACSPTDVLEVEDPDIINPSDVQSQAGAQAVRLGALARFNAAVTGTATTQGESLLMLGGLFADEWVNGDSFIARQEIDQRVITVQNNFLTDANRALHRARLSAEQAVALLNEYDPDAAGWQAGEMLLIQAYVYNIIAEHYCDGIVFSSVVDGRESYGEPITTTAGFQQALTLVDAGLAAVTGSTASDVRVRSALQTLKGRILVNLDRYADAATAVSAVASGYTYDMLHSQTTQSNMYWTLNNNARRYSVGAGEGMNGLNFATAMDPRLPVCVGGDPACRAIGVTNANRDDLTQPFHVQMLWPTRESSVTLLGGIEARMIEAEAQLAAGNAAGSLATLNAARTLVAGLAPLEDAGTPAARLDQLFRERAFWLFGRGQRVGDMRRLVRQYGRDAEAVFPTGAWQKGGNYGSDVNIPVPLAETNNPNVSPNQTCLSRSA